MQVIILKCNALLIQNVIKPTVIKYKCCNDQLLFKIFNMKKPRFI